MMDCDLIVIGAGSGGVRAARTAAQSGARVVLVEGSAVGGTCVNLGCIPKKLYAYASHYATAFEEAAGFGWSHTGLAFDWKRLKDARRNEIVRLNGVYEAMLEAAGVRLVRGWARLAGGHEVLVETPGEPPRALTGVHVLVATGGAPAKPEFEGSQWAINSDEVFDLPRLPRRMAVVGGGYIASEFASIFNGLGAEVIQVHRGAQILRGFDSEVAAHVQKGLCARGVELLLDSKVQVLSRTAQGVAVRLIDGRVFEVDVVLNATGRRPRTDGLGLAEAGCDLDADGYVKVDAQHRSSLASVFAVGDACSRIHLTPLALAQASQVVDLLFGSGSQSADAERVVPTAVFTDPPLAAAGLTEEQARVRLPKGRVYTGEFRPLRHTLSGSPSRSLMKLVVDDASDRVVGLHAAGDDAPEIVQGFAVAMQAGATKRMFDRTIGIHPTAAEEFCTMRKVTRTWLSAGQPPLGGDE
jgi:glutathione reductase (NADPH)